MNNGMGVAIGPVLNAIIEEGALFVLWGHRQLLLGL